MYFNKFNHLILFVFIIFIFLNINFLKLISSNINNIYINFLFNEVIIFDFVILALGLLFFREIFLKINEILSLKIFKFFIYMLCVGFIGILASIFETNEKLDNFNFIIFFYLNLFKSLIGLLIFIIIYDKYKIYPKYKLIYFFTFALASLVLITISLDNNLSRLYYPFSNKTNGYNLLGLVSGCLFFTSYGFYIKNRNFLLLINTFILFLITFFSFSKTAIISLFVIFIFYNVILNKNKSAKNLIITFILSIIFIFSLDIFKYTFGQNSISITDILIHPTTWYQNYNSFYYRIEHVWLSNFDKDMTTLTFLFGEGIKSVKTHDSLYFSIISRFGFVGLILFFNIILEIFKYVDFNQHSTISFILLFGLTSEMVLQSNIVNPLIYIIVYLNYNNKSQFIS
jgi:hypothetical protein